MAVVNSGGFWSLADVVRQRKKYEGDMPMIDLVSQDNGGLADDLVWRTGNDGDFGYKFMTNVYIPVPGTRRFNEGYSTDRSRSTEVKLECFNRSISHSIDMKMAQNMERAMQVFKDEKTQFALGFRQQLESDFFYGAAGSPGQSVQYMSGLSQIYNNRANENGQNIVTEGAASPDGTDNASIWLINHGVGVHMFSPQYSVSAGIQEVVHESPVSDGIGGTYPAISAFYDWFYGLAVPNWKHVVRIQFNAEDLTKTGNTGPDLVDLVKRGLHRLPSLGMGGMLRGYASPAVVEALDRQIGNSPSLGLSSQQAINSVRTERGVPVHGVLIKRCEALLTNETGVL